jgi:hypothetical protein
MGVPAPTAIPYTAPIPISKTTCLRAVAVKTDWKSSKTETHTYIFLNDVIRQPTNPPGFPSTWGSTWADYEMDPDIVNANSTIKEDLKSIPTMSLVMKMEHLFSATEGIYANPRLEGIAWERPGSIELIYPDGSEGLQVNCGARMYGGVGRWEQFKKHTFRLLFKSDYGPTKLEYPLFGEDATDQFDTIILRSNFNDAYVWGGANSQYIRDEYVRQLQLALGHPSADGTFVHLYVNGLYWGLYNPTERPEQSFAATYFGGNKEDWDALNSGEPVGNSSLSSWNAMINLARQGLSTNEAYQRLQGNNPDGTRNPYYKDYLDIDNYIGYLIANFFTGNTDWPGHNWYAAFNRVNSTGFKSFSWDAEWVIGMNSGLYDDRTGVNNSICEPYAYLRSNKEFCLRFADHVHRAFFNGGPLYVNPTNPGWNPLYPERNRPAALYAGLANFVERSMIAESARWGDVVNHPPYNISQWRSQRDWIFYTYMPQRSANVLQQLRNAGLYPNIVAPVFYINGSYKHGGRISQTDRLSMATPAGTIYHTFDSSDPRQYATGNPIGTQYTGPFTLPHSTYVKARVLSGSTWSALNEAVYAIGPVAENLRITEIMYHPQDANDPNEEFIELMNIGPQTLNLNLVKFTNGIDFTFPPTELAAGDFVVVVKNPAAFQARYGTGINVAGQYTGSLENAGERLRLEDALGKMILDFKYEDGWREITDGNSFSLTIINPANSDPNNWDKKDSWRASAYQGGSPGEDDSDILPNPGDVVINEVLAHSHAGAPDWIELANTTDQPIPIGGWYLSDSGSNLKKYKIAPGTVIPPSVPNGYKVFYENTDFNDVNDPGCLVPFALSENGETVYLSSAENGVLTGYREVEDFGASLTDVSLGRTPRLSTGNYNFVALISRTPEGLNAEPKVGPIVINEIMYNPDWPDGGSYSNDEYEYVELYNISGSAVTLYDSITHEPWKFTDGIEYTFPASPAVTIPAGEYIVVVRNKTAFNWRYSSVPSGKIYGPYSGHLNNGGESLELSQPGDVDELGERHYIRVDRINYSDGSHPDDCPGGVDLWPVDTDGLGKSLSRKVSAAYGNDPNNWTASAPSPATGNP